VQRRAKRGFHVRKQQVAIVAGVTAALVMLAAGSAYAIDRSSSHSGGHSAALSAADDPEPTVAPPSSEVLTSSTPPTSVRSTPAAPASATSIVLAPPTERPLSSVAAPSTPAAVRTTAPITVPIHSTSQRPTTSATALSGVSGNTTLTITNNSGIVVAVRIEDLVFDVPAARGAQVVKVFISAADANDIVTVGNQGAPGCGVGDDGPYFVHGGDYTMTLTASDGGSGTCIVDGTPQVVPAFTVNGPNGHFVN
jgi:hypothetical protein